jgi:hypothetical protein
LAIAAERMARATSVFSNASIQSCMSIKVFFKLSLRKTAWILRAAWITVHGFLTEERRGMHRTVRCGLRAGGGVAGWVWA